MEASYDIDRLKVVGGTHLPEIATLLEEAAGGVSPATREPELMFPSVLGFGIIPAIDAWWEACNALGRCLLVAEERVHDAATAVSSIAERYADVERDGANAMQVSMLDVLNVGEGR